MKTQQTIDNPHIDVILRNAYSIIERFLLCDGNSPECLESFGIDFRHLRRRAPVWARLKRRGWSVEQTLSTPLKETGDGPQ